MMKLYIFTFSRVLYAEKERPVAVLRNYFKVQFFLHVFLCIHYAKKTTIIGGFKRPDNFVT